MSYSATSSAAARPAPFDQVLASRYGISAIDMVHRGEFGCMVALRGNETVSVPLTEAINKNWLVDAALINVVLGLSEPIKTDKK